MNKLSWGIVLLATLGAGCAGPSLQDDDPRTAPAVAAGAAALKRVANRLLQTPAPVPDWETFVFPGKRFAPFEPVEVLDRQALRVKAQSSVSILRQRFEPHLSRAGRLSFSWRVDGLPEKADLSQASLADSPVRVVLAFEGDRQRWSPKVHRLSEMSRLFTGEELPYATLIYVWSVNDAPGSVVMNPRTDRIRKLVLDSGSDRLGQWRDHVRDVRADFLQAFGEEPGPLRAVALMTDTDNTQSRLTAWYGPLSLERAAD
ncbi:MAG: DUF3047 domain-containing protein [Hydrogenophaga sp.]|uniref:DUF3047 domain-containing protein n=1 Tax=Hydrogenophaga sp. TaxID=1904254 RepID=UPI003D0990B4